MFNKANLTASTKTANILSGDINEFVTEDSTIRIYAVSSAVGVNMTIQADSDVLMDDKEIVPIGTTLLSPDHLLAEFEVYAGTRLALYLRETAGVGTTDVLIKVEIE